MGSTAVIPRYPDIPLDEEERLLKRRILELREEKRDLNWRLYTIHRMREKQQRAEAAEARKRILDAQS